MLELLITSVAIGSIIVVVQFFKSRRTVAILPVTPADTTTVVMVDGPPQLPEIVEDDEEENWAEQEAEFWDKLEATYSPKNDDLNRWQEESKPSYKPPSLDAILAARSKMLRQAINLHEQRMIDEYAGYHELETEYDKETAFQHMSADTRHILELEENAKLAVATMNMFAQTCPKTDNPFVAELTQFRSKCTETMDRLTRALEDYPDLAKVVAVHHLTKVLGKSVTELHDALTADSAEEVDPNPRRLSSRRKRQAK